jgi:hypothetical protein
LHGDTLVPKLRGMHVSASDMVLLLVRQQPLNCATSLTSLSSAPIRCRTKDGSETIPADPFARDAHDLRCAAQVAEVLARRSVIPRSSTRNRFLAK